MTTLSDGIGSSAEGADTQPVAETPVVGLSCYDKHGTPIERGDIVKVFHFIGARGKRHFMYKQCLGHDRFPSGKRYYVFFSHMNFCGMGDRNGPYHMEPGAVLADYEIVQSIKCDHDTRTKATTAAETRSDGIGAADEPKAIRKAQVTT